MAIGTEQPEVLKPVIVANPIYVFQVQTERFTVPTLDAAFSTLILPSQPQQTANNPSSVQKRRILREHLFIRQRDLLCHEGDYRMAASRFSSGPTHPAKVFGRQV
jgi:hypothetical protein